MKTKMNKNKGKKIIKLLLIVAVMMSLLAGCGAKRAEQTMSSTAYDTSVSSPGSGTGDMDYGDTATSTSPEMAASEEAKAIGSPVGNIQTTEVPLDNMGANGSPRMMIENISMTLETLNYIETEKSMMSLIVKYNGYIETSNVTGLGLLEQESAYYNNTRDGSYTIRIPSTSFYAFVEEMKGLGNAINSSINRQDVTAQYLDVAARLNSLKLQEERLLEILKKATELQYMLDLEKELANVRYQIESYTTSMRDLENKVSFGTVNLTLREVIKPTIIEKEPVTVGERIASGFNRTITDLKETGINLFVWIVTNSPYLIILALLSIFVVFSIRKSEQKSRARRAQLDKTLEASHETKSTTPKE